MISFSTNIKTLELTSLEKSLVDLINFLTHSFHGGADASPAFREAIKKIQTEEFSKADVLIISDFIMNRIKRDLENKIIAC